MAIQPGINDIYEFDISPNEPAEIDMRPAIRGIVRDISNNAATGVVASRFHNTIAAVITEVCRRIGKSERLDRVCLSGGTFQNMYLLEKTVAELSGSGFHVFLHSR